MAELPAYQGLKFIDNFNTGLAASVYAITAFTTEILSNASIFDYEGTKQDPYQWVWDKDTMCVDGISEAAVGFISLSSLLYSWG